MDKNCLKPFKCIAAMDLRRGIGKNNNLPWRLPGEMKYFERISTNVKNKDLKNAVVMGRKTWESIPKKYKPLKNRYNVVLSSTLRDVPEGVILKKNFKEAADSLSQKDLVDKIESIFVIGGQSVYKEAIDSGYCDRIYLTHIMKDFDCDTYFPNFDESVFKRVSDPDVPEGIQEEKGIQYEFRVYQC